MSVWRRFQLSVKWLGVGCLLAGVLFYAAPACAEQLRTSLVPTALGEDKRNVFDLIVKEGGIYTDTALVYNLGNEPVRAFVFPGGYELRDNKIVETPITDNAPEEPGRWIEVADSEFVLGPKASRVVEFTIRVPEDADVGEHVAVLLTQAESVEKREISGSGLHINVRSGTRVYMTVPGDINRDLVVENIGHQIIPFWKLFTKELKFILKLRNDGNVTLRPMTNLRVRGWFGEVGYQEEAPYRKIARGSTQGISHTWIKRAPYFGRFVADFEIHLGEKRQVNKDGTEIMLPDEVIKSTYVFWIFPWIETVYLIILLFLLYLLRSLWLYVVIINRLKTKTEVYTVTKGDNLTTIGSKLGISPRILVKFNLIPWPYEVHPGDKLLVPVGKFTGGEWHSRVSDIVRDKNIWGGVWGHLFRRRNVHKLTHKHIQPTGRSAQASKTVVVEAGDTIEDVAKFAGVDKEAIIQTNRLRPPYHLQAGQELKIPTKVSRAKRVAPRRGSGSKRKKSTRRRKK